MIYEALAQLLREVFVDVQERHVSFSLGDLFEASHLRLQDVFVKTETFNMLHLPLALAAGYVGDLKIEGLVGAVAGAPLSLRVRNVCLVLRHADVQWDNELLLRFAKEFAIALWQSVLVPSFEGKPTASSSSSSSAFVSPGKWIASRVQAAVADMTVTMENIHIRVESEHADASIAYGVHIPVLCVSTRSADDQILHRRKQAGVEYPKASAAASKLIAMENPALYCDVAAERYWYDPLRPSSMDNSYLRFRECVLRGLQRDTRRDVCSATVLWLKLDFQRVAEGPAAAGGGSLSLAAIDIVTEGLKIDVDFDQLAALVADMERTKEFQTRQKMKRWRPSAVDRTHVTPPTASVRSDALFPALPEDIAGLLTPHVKQKRSPQWFRALWRYAARCVLLHLRKGDERHVRLFNEAHGKRQSHYDRQKERNAKRDRYMHLYTRGLNKSALELALRGRAALISTIRNPKRATSPSGASPSSPTNAVTTLPELPPLTPEERWELSDLVWQLPVYDQRVYRAMADHALHQEYGKRSAPPSPTRKISLGIQSPISDGTSDAAATPPPSPPKLPSFPVDFVANHHRITRSATEGAMGISPVTSPPLARVHAASTSTLLGNPSRGIDSPTAVSPSAKSSTSRAPISKQEWFRQTFFPKWVTSKNALPLVNWSLGAISVAVCRSKSDASPTTSACVASSSPKAFSTQLPAVIDDVIDEDDDGVSRSPSDVLVEIRIESCRGAVLLTKTPTVRALVELRVGLVHATLLDSRHTEQRSIRRHASSGLVEPSSSPPPRLRSRRRNWVSTDYIREPADGFFYVGLKYNAKELPGVSPAPLVACDNEEWDFKGRVCVGTINIEYHEDLVDTPHKLGDAGVTPTHASILRDVRASYSKFLSQTKLRSNERWSVKTPSNTTDTSRREDDKDSKLTNGYIAVPTAVPGRLTFAAAVDKWSEAKRASVLREAKQVRFLNAMLLHASTLEADLGSIQLTASVPTSHVQSALRSNDSSIASPTGTTEEFRVETAPITLKLQNRPLLDECLIDGAGVRAVYHSTKEGRRAAVQFLSKKLSIG